MLPEAFGVVGCAGIHSDLGPSRDRSNEGVASASVPERCAPVMQIAVRVSAILFTQRLIERRPAGCVKAIAVSASPLQNVHRRKSRPHLRFTLMQRNDGRAPDEIRPINFELNVAPHASGSVLVSLGKTCVICAVTIEETVPRWMKEQGVTGGWLTAEYSMLPYSTQPRKPRDITKGRLDGRSVEIQRLIGRSLRAVIDLEKLGPRTIWVDCDVLQADGGTRTTAITGASLALAIACRKFVRRKNSMRRRCKSWLPQ